MKRPRVSVVLHARGGVTIHVTSPGELSPYQVVGRTLIALWEGAGNAPDSPVFTVRDLRPATSPDVVEILRESLVESSWDTRTATSAQRISWPGARP